VNDPAEDDLLDAASSVSDASATDGPVQDDSALLTAVSLVVAPTHTSLQSQAASVLPSATVFDDPQFIEQVRIRREVGMN